MPAEDELHSAEPKSVQACLALLRWCLILGTLIVVRIPRLNLSTDVEEKVAVRGAKGEVPRLQLRPSAATRQIRARHCINHDFSNDFTNLRRPLLREPTVATLIPKRSQLGIVPPLHRLDVRLMPRLHRIQARSERFDLSDRTLQVGALGRR